MTTDVGKVQFLNCTPHDIVLAEDGCQSKTFAPWSSEVRLLAKPQKELPFQTLGVKVFARQEFIGVAGLGSIPEGSYILVSMPVGEFFAKHPELCDHWVFGPDTGPDAVVRNVTGRIVGTKRLVFYAAPRETENECYVCACHWKSGCYCPTCGTKTEEAALRINDTQLFFRDGRLFRTPVGVDLPLGWKEDDPYPKPKRVRSSPEEGDDDPEPKKACLSPKKAQD